MVPRIVFGYDVGISGRRQRGSNRRVSDDSGTAQISKESPYLESLAHLVGFTVKVCAEGKFGHVKLLVL